MRKSKEEINTKIIKYALLAISLLAIIVFGILLYSKKLNDDVKSETIISKQKMSNIINSVNTNKENTESASSQIGKNISESSNNVESKSNNTVSTNSTNKNTLTTTNVSNKTEVQPKTEQKENAKTNESKEEQNEKEKLNFEKPVEGDIIKEFAVDSLVYSNTLQEWTVHTGIDIKADKTTVVKAAENGIVKTIKNDPRYGLTIVIEHDDGFKTVYSNLLTSEFVTEGEKVQKGQSIGTVGNTASFEISDEPHLHFEIIKDSNQVNPTIYLK